MTLYLVVRRELYEADGRYSYLKFIHNYMFPIEWEPGNYQKFPNPILVAPGQFIFKFNIEPENWGPKDDSEHCDIS